MNVEILHLQKRRTLPGAGMFQRRSHPARRGPFSDFFLVRVRSYMRGSKYASARRLAIAPTSRFLAEAGIIAFTDTGTSLKLA